MPVTQRIWPFEISERVLPALPDGDYPNPACHNCLGVGTMYAWRIKSGPYKSPGPGKPHWLDLAGENGENLSGWYDCELLTADCPVCKSGRRAEYLAKNCGLDADQMQVSFALFGSDPGKQQAVEAVRQIVKNGSGWLTIHGSYGVGKTSLLFAAVNSAVKAGIQAHYTTAANLLADIRRRFADGEKQSASVEDAVANWIELPFLAVDEIDRLSLTQWTAETLFRILDARYQAMTTRATLIVSNTSPLELKPEYSYMVSRMRSGQIIQIQGADMRAVMRAVMK